MFQFLKNDKSLKKDIRLIFWIAGGACLVVFLLSFFAGCASQANREDSNHYVAQDYPCPKCGFPIPDKDVSPNIRMENKCPSCGKIFFGKPAVKSGKANNYQYGSYGPRNYSPTSIYRSNNGVKVFVVNAGGFEETETGFSFWNVWFRDIDVDRDYIRSFWTTTRY